MIWRTKVDEDTPTLRQFRKMLAFALIHKSRIATDEEECQVISA